MSDPALIKELFCEALEIADPVERLAFLDKKCHGNAELRNQVEECLNVHNLMGAGFMKQMAVPQGNASPDAHDVTSFTNTASKALGTHVGPYELISVLGEGGMGTVYRARQHTPVRRDVAIKLIKEGMVSATVVARFDAERQALALMDHPNIAKVFDAGTTPKGQPYFVMELVDGPPVTAYCIEKRLKLRERLNLFVDICRAINHAHRKGVIHRDIKPSNILVTVIDGKPVPKVIDFGVAKAIDQKLTDESLHTQAGLIIGTLDYMSPEQAGMGASAVDTRTDVYALGVVLYELLTGSTPFDSGELRKSAIFEALRIIREREPLKPSTRLSGFYRQTTHSGRIAVGGSITLEREVRGELDWISLKALDKVPARRYQSADDLALDIERHLCGEPVEASPDSSFYRLQKFIGRNKIISAAIGAVAAALLIGMGLAVWQADRAFNAEKDATAQRDAAIKAGLEQERLRKDADVAREKAVAAEAQTVKEKEATRGALAQATLALADGALRDGNGLEMQALLKKVPDDLRDSTWQYLTTQSDSSIATLGQGTEENWVAAAHPKLPSVFAIGGKALRVRLQNVTTGKMTLEFAPNFPEANPNDGMVSALAISPGAERIAVGLMHNPGVAIHRVVDGKPILRLDSTCTAQGLQFSANGKTLLQTCERKGLILWDAISGKQLWSYMPDGAGIMGVLSQDGKTVAVKGWFIRLVLLNAKDGTVIRELSRNYPNYIAYRPDNKAVLSGTRDGTIYSIDPSDGRVQFQVRPYEEKVDGLAYTRDGKHFYSISPLKDGTQRIQIWNATSGAFIRHVLGGTGNVYDVNVHPVSGELLVTGHDARAWRPGGAPPAWSFPSLTETSVAFWGSDDIVLAPFGNAACEAIRLQPGTATSLLKLTDNHSFIPKLSADGRMAVAGRPGNNSKMIVLRKSGDVIEQVARPRGDVSHWCLSPNGDRIACTNWHFVIIDAMTGDEELVLSEEQFNGCVEWLDSERILSVGTFVIQRGHPDSEERLTIWDARTGRKLKEQRVSTQTSVLMLAPDKRSFAEGGADKHIRIRVSETFAVIKEFRAHDGPISALAWYPSGRILATGSADRRVRLWNLETGKMLDEFADLGSAPHQLSFSPSGKRFGCAARDKVTRIWELPNYDDLTPNKLPLTPRDTALPKF